MEEVERLYKEMVGIAGSDLASKIENLWEGHKDIAVFWFYKQKFFLENKSPADYCKEGKKDEIERYVGQLEHGVFP